MATSASRADRIAAIVAADADFDAVDLTIVDALVVNLQAALATIDGDSLLSPGEQLALLAVGAVRGLVPLLAAEADSQVAAAEAKLARRASS